MNKWEEPEKEIKRKKVRRKRKPMTDEQKKAAAERLALARAAKGPVKNLSLPENLRDLTDDHYLSPKKVKQWIKVWKSKLTGIKYWKDSKDRKERLEYQIAEAYVKNMQNYLTTGIWSDFRYGENREHKIVWKVVAPAFDSNGEIKRSQGYFYDDIGFYGNEEEENDNVNGV